MWDVKNTDEFAIWWQTLDLDEQRSVLVCIKILRQLGPLLGRPYADTVKGSRHSNMKELRSQCKGKPLRTFFAMDPLRHAILLIGGDKTGDNRFYERMIPLADKIFDEHLEELRKKGLI